MDLDISPDIKTEILTRKLSLWNNTLFDAATDEKLGRILEDEAISKAAQVRMKTAIKALEGLKGMIKDLNGSTPQSEPKEE